MRDDLFNYSISYMFNQLYISEEVKAQFEVYGEELRSVFAKRIENNSWLSVETKAAAQDKLSKMNFFYGGPDEWLAEGFPAPEGELLVDDILELKASRTRMIAAIMDQSLFTESMNYMMFAPGGLSLNSYNAIYIIENNSVNIFPALMMEPEWSEEMDPAEMYATFQVIGHEITHGFDKDGSAVDAYGEENNWWTAEDKEKFLALNDKLSAQISTFEVAPGILTDGERTIAEDVADLGGLNIAFDAMNEFMKEYLECKVIVVCRGIAEEEIVNVAQAMYDGGIRFMEIPFNQSEPTSFESTVRKIKAVKEALDGKMHVGAGTVITMEQFYLAEKAGAEIIVSPTMEEDIITATKKAGLISMPGCTTSSEMSPKSSAMINRSPATSFIALTKAMPGPFTQCPALAVVASAGMLQ
jgi:2-keto-3-deoxy-6-phosphogluconate aldolase